MTKNDVYTIEINQDSLDFINNLSKKDCKIIKEHLHKLENLRQAPDVELLEKGYLRMHISHKYTALFDVLPGNRVRILDVMTIEQAHKRYDRY